MIISNESEALQVPKIKLISSEDEEFVVDVDIVQCSNTITAKLKDLEMSNNDEPVIPLPDIKSPILKKVIDWLEYHKDDPPRQNLNENRRDMIISEWDKNFCDVEFRTLLNLCAAAHHLDIDFLADITAFSVAKIIKGKTCDDLRTLYGKDECD